MKKDTLERMPEFVAALARTCSEEPDRGDCHSDNRPGRGLHRERKYRVLTFGAACVVPLLWFDLNTTPAFVCPPSGVVPYEITVRAVSVLFARSPDCSIATHSLRGEKSPWTPSGPRLPECPRIPVNKAMPDANIQTPDWLRKMESILEELNEGVIIGDSHLHIVFANEALLELSQYQRGELLGRTPDAIFPPEDIPHIIQQHESRHRDGRSRSEFYLPRKDGGKIPVIYSARTIQAPDGQEYALVIVTDISVQKRVEEQLRESNTLLQKRQNEMEAELALAARVQQSLAPHSLVWRNLAVESYYSPAHKIGGDFGVVLPQDDDFLNLVMCDVSGHGVGAALMANRIYSETFDALERRIGPGILLRRLHEFVENRIPVDGFYFTMAAARFSQQGRRVSFAAAGHPPAILVSNGVLRLLESQNGILGCLSETAPSDSANQVELVPGDRLVLYTDGLVEVFNRRDEMLGVKGLTDLVRQSATLPLADMQKAILDGVAEWKHDPFTDDVSLVIVGFR
jgi:phosphoserine phosphatase RsbU/P